MATTINLSISKGLRSLMILAPAALLLGATGCVAPPDAADEADDQVDQEEPLSDQQDAALKAGVALKDVTYRVTDDVSTKLVTTDRPGRTMDAAGNSTMSWVYGRANVAGVCDDLYGKIGLKSEQELFSGGVCLKVAGYGTVFHVVDKLEDGQACGDASRQHLDVHLKEYGGLHDFVQGHKDTSMRLVDCGTEAAEARVIFQDWDQGSDKHKVVRFYGLPAPVTSVSLHLGGKILGGKPRGAGQYLFEDFSGPDLVGTHAVTVMLRHADGHHETTNLDVAFPSAKQIHQFEVIGNDVHRKGKLDLLEVHSGEGLSSAIHRAQERKQCIEYLTAHPSASSARAASEGHCGA